MQPFVSDEASFPLSVRQLYRKFSPSTVHAKG